MQWHWCQWHQDVAFWIWPAQWPCMYCMFWANGPSGVDRHMSIYHLLGGPPFQCGDEHYKCLDLPWMPFLGRVEPLLPQSCISYAQLKSCHWLWRFEWVHSFKASQINKEECLKDDLCRVLFPPITWKVNPRLWTCRAKYCHGSKWWRVIPILMPKPT